jgi:hypothetical protein
MYPNGSWWKNEMFWVILTVFWQQVTHQQLASTRSRERNSRLEQLCFPGMGIQQEHWIFAKLFNYRTI